MKVCTLNKRLLFRTHESVGRLDRRLVHSTPKSYTLHTGKSYRNRRHGVTTNAVYGRLSVFLSSQHVILERYFASARQPPKPRSPKDSKGSKGPRTPPHHSTSRRVPGSGHQVPSKPSSNHLQVLPRVPTAEAKDPKRLQKLQRTADPSTPQHEPPRTGISRVISNRSLHSSCSVRNRLIRKSS